MIFSKSSTKTLRKLLTVSTVSLLSLWLCAFVRATPQEVQFPVKHRAFFKAHCLDCHDSSTQEGKVDLESLSFKITSVEQAELWQKVLNALNSGEMPPEDSGQPGNDEKADFLDDLAKTMVDARKALSDSGGKITMRRLNRREYRNTIEHLTGVKVDVGSLPNDGGSGTFDTVGSSQFISSDQFEQYLKLGRQAVDEAFERQATQNQPSRVFRVEPEKTINPDNEKEIAQIEDAYKRFTRWQVGVDKAATTPENKAKIAELSKKESAITHPIHFYKYAHLLNGAPDPADFGFRDSGKAAAANPNWDREQLAYHKRYAGLPHRDRGAYLKLAHGTGRVIVSPKKIPPGNYVMRVRVGAIKGTPASRRFIQIGHPQRQVPRNRGLDGSAISSHQVSGTIENPETIEIPLEVVADTPREFAVQEKQPNNGNLKALWDAHNKWKKENGYGTPPAIWIDWIELEGPLSNAGVASKVHRVELEKTVNVKNLQIIKSMENTYQEKWLPWKKGVDKAARAPENQEIVAALRKEHPDYDSNPTLKYRKAGLLKGAPDPRDYGGSDPINAVAALYSPYRRYHNYMKHYAALPHNDRGAYLKLARGVQRFDVRSDSKDMPPGNYKLRIRTGAVEGSDPSRHFIEIGHPQNPKGTSAGFAKLLSTQQVSGTIENPETIEVNVEIGANTARVVGIQERQPKSEKLLRKEFERHKQKNGYGTPPAIWVDWMELEGPIVEGAGTESRIVRVEPEKTINPNNEKEIAQTEERQRRFAQWKKGVDEAAKTSENQAIIAKIRKTDRMIDHPNRFYTFADRLKGTPNPKDFGFGDAKKAAASDPSRSRSLALNKHFVKLPHRDRGAYLKLAHGTGRVIVSPKNNKLPPGSYVMRVRVGVVEGTPTERRFIQVGHPQRQIESRNWGLEGRAISTHQVTGTIDNPETIEIPLEVTSDTIREFAVQEKQPNNGNLKALWNAHNEWKTKNGYGHPPAIWIDWVELEGPLSNSPVTETSSLLQAILDKHPSPTERQGASRRSRDDAKPAASALPVTSIEAEQARAIFSDFAHAAFRRAKPEAAFIDKLVVIYETRRKAGDSFDVAIRTPLSVILASPGFLYFNEPGSGATTQKGKLRNWTNAGGETIAAELIALEAEAVTLRMNEREYRYPISALSEADRDYIKQWREEASNPSRSRTLADRELAVRLSYFLWSGPPDGELLQLAEQNKLHLPEVLRQQVDRLIADPRSDEFVAGFVHQWLDMERLDFFQFDVNLHRDFDESTRAACRGEVYESFAHLLRANGNPKRERGTKANGIPGSGDGLEKSTNNDGRIGKLLKSDYVFVNGLLATYYGIEGVTGDEFRKIKLPAGSPRGGLLGMAAIHAMGSDGIVSSPVERGAWVLRHLLNDPPPPAPPNVPQISRLEGEILTTRERVLVHQEEAQCASCHRKIDPIGFGLENFNASGKWRTKDSYQVRGKKGKGVGKKKTWTIDASGAFHKGPAFSDYHQLRDLIAKREDDFARGFTEHLIEYALGRPFGFTDEDLANEIVNTAKSKKFAVSEFIQAVVQSDEFRTKQGSSTDRAGAALFKSSLFKTGKLIYWDDFNGEYNQERWGAQKKDRQISDGKLVVTPLFKSKEEAMKALKRDHHLGLEPVVHLNQIPEAFVCHIRFKFEMDKLTPGRPVLQIGHHMIAFNHLETGGHRINLPDGPSFTEPKSGLKLGDWIDLVIEYKSGEITIGVNGYSKTYKHETVTIINEKDKHGPRFTFKGGPNCRILFDSVRLWKCDE